MDLSVRSYLIVSAVVFGIVSAIHLIRALRGWAFAVGPFEVPVIASWVGFLVTAALAVWALRLALVASGQVL